jgi:hypothetical protein
MDIASWLRTLAQNFLLMLSRSSTDNFAQKKEWGKGGYKGLGVLGCLASRNSCGDAVE